MPDICGRHGVKDIFVIMSAVISGGAIYIVSLWLLSVKKYRKSVQKQTA